MKIAICISGQIRSSDERLAEIQREAEEVGADVFISVWKLRGGKTFDAGHPALNIFRIFGPKTALFFPQNWADKFRQVFPNWQSFLPKQDALTKKKLAEIFPDAQIEIEPDMPQLDLPAEMNSLRMLYKIDRCNRMKKSYENEAGFRYDRVIRVRPDILLSLKLVAETPYAGDEVHLKIRGGQTLHDTYWLGSSDVDDKMAEFYGFAVAERKDDWKGIHSELASYVKKIQLKPVNLHCVKTGFEAFGEYSKAEKALILANLRKGISAINETSGMVDPDAFVCFMSAIFECAAKNIEHTGISGIGKALSTRILSISTDFENASDVHLVLPPVTVLAAMDPNINERARGALVFDLLTNDALSSPTYFPLRAAGIIEHLPSFGVELLPYLTNWQTPHQSGKPDEISGYLGLLWQNRFEQYEPSLVDEARQKVVRVVLNNNQSRILTANFLLDNDRIGEYLALALAYKAEFPERNNATKFVMMAKRMVDTQNS